ncbi:MAG: ribosome rescue protein RqcH [Candidatus Methanoperedens sp.]|nr:ribosome rescue protein RqcH [Candidatus Methanoperedens sp.]MCZ7358801.1 ribosome rescue protein RqcH [Candidatus Methanoperedens sp.]
MSSVDVASIVKELKSRLIDAKIAKVYQHSQDEIRIGLHIFNEGRTNLVVEAGRRMHLTVHPETAPKFPQSFPMLLRKYLSGGRIIDISQYDFDRIIKLHIQRGEDKTILLIELFSRGNIILLDAENRIILPLKSISFRERKVMRGELYELPAMQISPTTATPDELKDMFSHSDTDIVRTLATRMNMGGQYAEEICLRAGIDKNTPAAHLRDVAPVFNAMQEVFGPLGAELRPHIVLEDSKKIDVLPFELSQFEKYEKRYSGSFNEALDEYFSKEVAEKKDGEEKKPEPRKQGLLEHRLQKQTQALLKFREEEGKLVHKGELIYAHYQRIDGILSAIKTARDKGYSWDDIRDILRKSDIPESRAIRSINQSKGTITVNIDDEEVELDIRLSVHQNSQVYYDRAKKISSKIKGALKAIEETKKLTEKQELPEIRKKPQRPKAKWYEQFRWFFSSDGFLVIGGRDAQSNEDIVKKYLEKRDIFFHAHVSGSPAVIIKTEGKEVPQTSLLEAAQFTVSYSGIWKSGQASGDCYWVHPEQVSKTPESGEYVAKGAFVIRGTRNYYRDVMLGIALGLEDDNRLIGGSVSAVKKKAKLVFEIEPGEFNQNDLSKKIYRMLNEKFEDKRLIKAIASPDRIAMFLPPGGSKLKEG